VQEAVIGVVFVLAATGGVLLLASNVHGSEHLRDLLVGQILWVQPRALAWTATIYAALPAVWFGVRERLGRVGFYLIFAVAVTVSVQRRRVPGVRDADRAAARHPAHAAPPPCRRVDARRRGLRRGAGRLDRARPSDGTRDRVGAGGPRGCLVRAQCWCR